VAPRAFSSACAFNASVWRISSGVAGWCVNAAAGTVPARTSNALAAARVEYLTIMIRLLDRVDLSVSSSHTTLTRQYDGKFRLFGFAAIARNSPCQLDTPSPYDCCRIEVRIKVLCERNA